MVIGSPFSKPRKWCKRKVLITRSLTSIEKVTEIEWENRLLLERIANIMIKDKSSASKPSGGGDFNHNTSMQSDSLARDSLSMTLNDISIERIEE